LDITEDRSYGEGSFMMSRGLPQELGLEKERGEGGREGGRERERERERGRKCQCEPTLVILANNVYIRIKYKRFNPGIEFSSVYKIWLIELKSKCVNRRIFKSSLIYCLLKIFNVCYILSNIQTENVRIYR